MMTVSRAELLSVAAIFATSLPAVVFATDVQFVADVGVGASGNIRRTLAAKQSETIEQIGMQFSVLKKTARISADIRGDLEYLNYHNDSFPSEVVGNAGAAFDVALIEDRLSWSLDDVFGQTRRDPFSVTTPLNRENVNYFSTGPNAVIHLGGANRLFFGARYGKVSYESSLFDTDRFRVQAAYQYDVSSASNLALHFRQESVNPQAVGAEYVTYKLQEAFAQYGLNGTRSKVSLELGGSRVDRSGLADSGVLVRLSASRAFNDVSTVSVRMGRHITDAGNSLGWSGGSALPTAGTDTQAIARTANPYVATYGELGLQLTGRRTHIAVSGSLNEERYESSPQSDRRRYGASVQVDRNLTSRLSARAGFVYNRFSYKKDSESNEDKNFDLGLDWKLGRHISLDLSTQRYHYGSTVIAGSANETRFWLKAKYTK